MICMPSTTCMRSVLAGLVALLLSATGGFGQSACDGMWRIGVIVDAGSFDRCTPELSHRVIVRNGMITPQTAPSGFTFQGNVDEACKNVRFWVIRNNETAEGVGTITRDRASGSWKVTVPANRRCSGVWNAAKR
jgi:hypothetical protein